MLNNGSTNSTSIATAINSGSTAYQQCAWFRRPHTPLQSHNTPQQPHNTPQQPHNTDQTHNQCFSRQFSLIRTSDVSYTQTFDIDLNGKLASTYHPPYHPPYHTPYLPHTFHHSAMLGTTLPTTTYFNGSAATTLIMDTSSHATVSSQLLSAFNDNTCSSLSIDCAIDVPASSSINHSNPYPTVTDRRTPDHTPGQTPTLVHYYSPNSYVLCVQSNHSRPVNSSTKLTNATSSSSDKLPSDKVLTILFI